MADLKNPKLIWLKGILFLVLGVSAAALLYFQAPGVRTLVLIGLAIWAFCRAYYFAFYVIQHYVDDQYRFSGLLNFLQYAYRCRSAGRSPRVIPDPELCVPKLGAANYDAFIAEKPVAAVHFDAPWNRPRAITRHRMTEAQETYGAQVNLGEVDVDIDGALAKSTGVLNLPAVAYYRHGELIAVLIGAEQNIKGRIGRILAGQPIGYDDGCQ